MSEIKGSELYKRIMKRFDQGVYGHAELMHKAWDGTPWIVDVCTDSIGTHRYREIMDWCRDQFGPEAWPLHEKEGRWHSGSVTFCGYTWMGFVSEEIMEQFCRRWAEES